MSEFKNGASHGGIKERGKMLPCYWSPLTPEGLLAQFPYSKGFSQGKLLKMKPLRY